MTRPKSADLVNVSYARMELYASPRVPTEIDLSDNTNQRGAPPSALRVLSASGSAALSRYPSHYADELKRAIADLVGVGADQIVTGCGSDDVLDSAVRAFAVPGEALAYPEPTFAMVPYFAHMNGLTPRPVPLLPASRGFDVDADGLLAQRAKITYLCSPNNPTGTLASDEAVDRVLRDAAGLVIVDEAYVDYGGRSLAARARAEERLLVVRTLSKAFGLAGARVGYAVGAPELVREVEKSRGPYKITALAERMAVAALDEDRAWVAEGVREVLVARDRFVAWLGARGLAPLPTAANFVLVPAMAPADKARALRARGVAVRAFPALAGLGDALRISIGPWDVMERALPALEEVLT